MNELILDKLKDHFTEGLPQVVYDNAGTGHSLESIVLAAYRMGFKEGQEDIVKRVETEMGYKENKDG